MRDQSFLVFLMGVVLPDNVIKFGLNQSIAGYTCKWRVATMDLRTELVSGLSSRDWHGRAKLIRIWLTDTGHQ